MGIRVGSESVDHYQFGWYRVQKKSRPKREGAYYFFERSFRDESGENLLHYNTNLLSQ